MKKTLCVSSAIALVVALAFAGPAEAHYGRSFRVVGVGSAYSGCGGYAVSSVIVQPQAIISYVAPTYVAPQVAPAMPYAVPAGVAVADAPVLTQATVAYLYTLTPTAAYQWLASNYGAQFVRGLFTRHLGTYGNGVARFDAGRRTAFLAGARGGRAVAGTLGTQGTVIGDPRSFALQRAFREGARAGRRGKR